MEVKEQKDMGLELSSGTNKVFVYPKGEAHESATYTVLNFTVEDIDKAVEELTDKGVKFEQYDYEQLKTNEKGIADFGEHKQAWFTDPAGNIFSVIQPRENNPFS